MENQVEIWKTLPGVTGVEVSTFGRVHILDSLISSENKQVAFGSLMTTVMQWTL